MGVPQSGPSKFKLFKHSCWTHELFRVGKYEEKFPNRDPPKFKNFNLLKWTHEMVVHEFPIFLFEATFAFLQHQLLPKGVSPVQA